MGLREAKGVMFLSGDPEGEILSAPYAAGELGNFAEYDWGSGNVCRYRLVKVASGITTAVGNLLYWSDKGKFEVTTANAKRAQLAGVARAVAGAGKYIWMLTNGDRGVLFVAAPTSAPDANGKPVVASATDGKADCLALATAPTVGLVGTTLSVTAADIATVRVNIPDEA